MRRRDLYDNLRIVQIYPFSLTKGNKIKAEKDKVAAFRASIRLELTRACAHGIIRGSDNIRCATVHTLFLAWLQYLQSQLSSLSTQNSELYHGWCFTPSTSVVKTIPSPDSASSPDARAPPFLQSAFIKQ